MKKFFMLMLSITLVVTLTACSSSSDSNKEKKKEDETVSKEEKVPEVPAEDSEVLTKQLPKLEAKKVTKNRIELSENTKVKEGEKIAVWIYSKPKFLGYFKVKVENGKKVIEGLEAALKKVDVEDGNHNIALVTEEGTNIGYVDVYVHKDGDVVSKEDAKIEKEETVTGTIEFKAKKIYDANMANGKSVVTTKGEKGTKEVTYKVVYDSEGKVLSKTKINEKVIKEAVDQVVKVGTSDFNTKSAKMTGSSVGFACTKTITYGDTVGCDETSSKNFKSISVNKVSYVYSMDGVNITKAIKMTKSGNLYIATINGKKYYLDSRAGSGDNTPLTAADCKTYKLSCGSW